MQSCSEKNSQRTRCEVWTRVMGYHRPVSHFNIGKKSEHYSRKHFTAVAAANSAFVKHYALPVTSESAKILATC